MNNNDCFVIEREDAKQFSEDVTFAMNKGYNVSSTSIVQYTEYGETKIKYIAIMIKLLT